MHIRDANEGMNRLVFWECLELEVWDWMELDGIGRVTDAKKEKVDSKTFGHPEQ